MTTEDIAWDSLLNRYDIADAFVAIVDSDFVLRAASPAIGAALLIDPAGVIGRSTAELIHPDDILRALDVFRGNRAANGLVSPNVYRIRTSASGIYRSFGVTSQTVMEGAAVVLQLSEPTQQDRSQILTLEQIDIFEMMGNGRSLEDCLLALVVMVERNSDGARAIVHIDNAESKLQPIASGSLPKATRDRYRGMPIDTPGGLLQHALTSDVHHAESSEIASYPRVSVAVARHDNDAIAGYLELLHPNDNLLASDVSAQRMAAHLVGLIVDRYASDQHPTAALQDELTGLPNRRALMVIAEQFEGGDTSCGLIALDVDGFADFNSIGHAVGDVVLASVARAIRGAIPPEAMAFRSGGDEFVIMIPEERRSSTLVDIGQQILEALDADAVDLGDSTRRLSVSIGVSASADQNESFSELLGQADTAMRVAKRDGGHRVRTHDQPLDSRWVHRKALAEALPDAIVSGDLFLEFQPIISLVSHYVVGFEALSRWNHPRFGTLSPGDFLPIAEETSLIQAVDTWVLDTAAQQVSAWSGTGRRPLDLWVNLSARSLARQDLVEQILGLQARHHVQIGVELAERDSFVSSFHSDNACERLRTAGIKVALDDFGAGRSSLFRAVFHGPSVLKIDRSFVNGMLASEPMMKMVATILDLGRQLGLAVIAEGVESEEQMRQLEIMGCELAQGYLFAPPLTADVIEQRLGPRFDDLRVVQLSATNQASHDLDV